MIDELAPKPRDGDQDLPPPKVEALGQTGEIAACCVETIRQHVRYNPMMVCADCKNIIKCFSEERAFQNYLTFCRSRRRTVLTGVVGEHYTVAFRSYDTYGR